MEEVQEIERSPVRNGDPCISDEGHYWFRNGPSLNRVTVVESCRITVSSASEGNGWLPRGLLA